MNLTIIIIGTIGIILFSWFLSIKHKRYHGISRFFSFESIFLIILINIKVWFNNPFSPLQLLSWTLLIVSLVVVYTGYKELTGKGEPASDNFENTSVLVKSGIYKYIRHPLYLSLFLLGTGAMLKDAGYLQIFLGTINLISVWITARIEETEMIAKFGDTYKEYMQKTYMFIPLVI